MICLLALGDNEIEFTSLDIIIDNVFMNRQLTTSGSSKDLHEGYTR